ncbi:MAG: helix-turn-helix domain-containing protein [Terriglobales bacterium]
MVERVMLLAVDNNVDRSAVELALPGSAKLSVSPQAFSASGPLASRVDAFEKQTILSELKRHSYNMTATARELGLERSHLYKKCQQLGIDLASLKTAGES